jgi:hypothetical protein
MPTRYVHFVQVLRDDRWVDFESYDDLERAHRRAVEFRRLKIPVQVVSAKSTQPLEPNS